MTRLWGDLPTDRMVHIDIAGPEIIELSMTAMPDGAPAMVTYYPPTTHSQVEAVTAILDGLEAIAVDLFPAWLPGAEDADLCDSACLAAVRALALRIASTTHHFGPFLADLAESVFCTTVVKTTRFAPEIRAVGLSRVIAASFDRPYAVLVLRVPEDLPPDAERALVAAGQWLAHRGGLGVWLAGPPLHTVDGVETIPFTLPDEVARLAQDVRSEETYPIPHTLRYLPPAGKPHPASKAEKRLESALAQQPWAVGRAWNQTHQFHALTNPVRVDLLWADERCVVEIDGPEHCHPILFAADRHRDVWLQLSGYAVLRFTNSQILSDVDVVVSRIGQFIRGRRFGAAEGQSHE